MPHIAPLIALVHFPATLGQEGSFDEIRTALIAQAGQFIHGHLFTHDKFVPAALRQDLLAEALVRIRSVMAALGASPVDVEGRGGDQEDYPRSVGRIQAGATPRK